MSQVYFFFLFFIFILLACDSAPFAVAETMYWRRLSATGDRAVCGVYARARMQPCARRDCVGGWPVFCCHRSRRFGRLTADSGELRARPTHRSERHRVCAQAMLVAHGWHILATALPAGVWRALTSARTRCGNAYPYERALGVAYPNGGAMRGVHAPLGVTCAVIAYCRLHMSIGSF